MSYINIKFKASYESGVDDLVQDFYVPVLENSASYDRIAGFFSSSSLAIAARGIAGLIQNHGKMRIITSPRLSTEDARILASIAQGDADFFTNILLSELEVIQSEFERDHIQALGWMMANGYLEMKLAVPMDGCKEVSLDRLFHQKIGILTDKSGNSLSFSGSINESASGWLNNIEEFKVFCEWIPGHVEFYEADRNRFADFWNGRRAHVRVVDIPQAVKERFIMEGEHFSVERLAARHYIRNQKNRSVDENLSLFPYQQDALKMWIDSGCQLLFEMATGTGKTRTALACVNHAMKHEKRLIVIVACPQTTLSKQWRDKEVEPAGFQFDAAIVADGTNRKWREQLSTLIKQISIGYHSKAIIYTTHTTGSHKDFTDLIEQSNPSISFCFVGDEAHGLGAPKSKYALLDRYRYRIGLSATPKRWFDDYGTHILSEFFGEKSFVFSISDALTTLNPLTNKPFLVNYYYHPVFLTLSEAELETYKELSSKIQKLSNYASKSDEYQKIYESLLFARANIQKNAEMKYPALDFVLSKMGHVDNTLIFVSDVQLDNVMLQLKQASIMAHRFTEKQGTTPRKEFDGLSERQYLIERFQKKDYHALVAISCLDEGIDIPSADTAILMANSTNPREYVQRIGRVIRQAKDKSCAHIYDFIVEPNQDHDFPPEIQSFEKDIFTKELHRACDMAKNAINNADVYTELNRKLEEVRDYGVK